MNIQMNKGIGAREEKTYAHGDSKQGREPRICERQRDSARRDVIGAVCQSGLESGWQRR